MFAFSARRGKSAPRQTKDFPQTPLNFVLQGLRKGIDLQHTY
jgi:hypothetical protein